MDAKHYSFGGWLNAKWSQDYNTINIIPTMTRYRGTRSCPQSHYNWDATVIFFFKMRSHLTQADLKLSIQLRPWRSVYSRKKDLESKMPGVTLYRGIIISLKDRTDKHTTETFLSGWQILSSEEMSCSLETTYTLNRYDEDLMMISRNSIYICIICSENQLCFREDDTAAQNLLIPWW